MPFCYKCGAKLNESARFCHKCGAPQSQAAVEVAQHGLEALPDVAVYAGKPTPFSLLGQSIVVSAEMDVFNHYRLVFRALAKNAADRLKRQYEAKVRTIDDFLIRFDDYYLEERKPLLEKAFSVLSELGYYDITLESFAEQHTNDFCLIAEDLQTMLDSFNATIEANQDRRARALNLMPGIIFNGGVSGILGAVAYNVGVNAVAEAAISKANVSRSQRVELYRRINKDTLIYRAYLDYWRIFLSMTYAMKTHGYPVWYPSDESAERIKNISVNLKAGRVPKERVPELFANIVSTNPYNNDCFIAINTQFPGSDEVKTINDYFGFNGTEV